MSEYQTLPIVGEDLGEDEWVEVEGDIEAIESCGLRVIKILNFKEGSTKYIAQVDNGLAEYRVRRRLESRGWMMISPYYSRGRIIGFKVAKALRSGEANAWGD